MGHKSFKVMRISRFGCCDYPACFVSVSAGNNAVAARETHFTLNTVLYVYFKIGDKRHERGGILLQADAMESSSVKCKASFSFDKDIAEARTPILQIRG